MSVHPLIKSLKASLIVSVQAYPGEPLRTPETMAQMSRACELGGAAAIRCQGLSDIAAIKGRVEVPVIGLWKDGHEGVYITPTLRHAAPASPQVLISWPSTRPTVIVPTVSCSRTRCARFRKRGCCSWPTA